MLAAFGFSFELARHDTHTSLSFLWFFLFFLQCERKERTGMVIVKKRAVLSRAF
jgi:hypothetical protein